MSSGSPHATRIPHDHVLLVDDHAGFRRVVAELLGLRDGSFHEASDGKEAMDYCHQVRGAPDLILMDLDMPVMDGLAATRAILRDSPSARIVILTQHDDPRLRQAALEAGACVFHSKLALSELPGILSTLPPHRPE
ncbi:response regulator [Luteolibacter marinus]|uniref:response regulator n=1 Tax=Luteolibacter marinus TaxID=2776705 RepID=UPI001866096E|nr:response regulator transcription factor [Luteolibacter marinus]